MNSHRRVKIVATLGPATDTAGRVLALAEAGVDVFRLNASHGDHASLAARAEQVRRAEAALGRPLALLLDLQGPKLRVGRMTGGQAALADGARFRLDLDAAPGDERRAPFPHGDIYDALIPGTRLLLDDGRLELEVADRTGAADGRALDCTVVRGGVLRDNKGVNVPGAMLPLSAMTDKDRADLAFGLDLGVDWVALSFVQRPADVEEARAAIAGRASLVAKLEKPSAIDHVAAILSLSDAVMVARGDLGVEMPAEEVPRVQKRVVRLARAHGKPVIVATQMLDSMIDAPTPTRAEASDVATAVYDGADAVMLSAETAIGRYPVEAVAMMGRIAARVEDDPLYRSFMDAEHALPEATAADAISAAARQVAETVNARAIVTYTNSGSTALRAARERPEVPILALTPREGVARRLALAWGVTPMPAEDPADFTDIVRVAIRRSRQAGLAARGDRIVITAGVPFGVPGSTNTLRLAWIEEEPGLGEERSP